MFDIDHPRRTRRVGMLALTLILPLAACGDDSPVAPPETTVLAFDFDAGTAARWEADLVDVAVDQEDDVGFQAGPRPLPAPLEGDGLWHSGLNVSDDLFMFFRTRVDGLAPGATYRASFTLDFASDRGNGCDIGIGGSVWLKVGASTSRPGRIVENGHLRLTVDKGNQRNSGRDALLIGDIRNGVDGCGDDVPFALRRIESPETLDVTADGQGRLWLFFGSESGFEAGHEVYFDALRVRLEPR